MTNESEKGVKHWNTRRKHTNLLCDDCVTRLDRRVRSTKYIMLTSETLAKKLIKNISEVNISTPQIAKKKYRTK